MELSILIPVYNWNIVSLLERLMGEIDSSITDGVELIVIDDCSTDAVQSAANYSYARNEPRTYFEYSALDRNAGRSVVRNLLASRARGDYLLFLDCDILPDSPSFIRDYLSYVKHNEFDVICGGRSYAIRVLQDKAYDFHVYFGNKKEVCPASIRSREPWKFVLTSNIMVRRKVFACMPFDERFVGYGYEDIEWGIRLSRNHRILHIENSASHIGLQTKTKLHEKMRESVQNYQLLGELYPEARDSAAISRFARFFCLFPSGWLRFFDVCFMRFFLQSSISSWLSFISFQLDFAVLIALAHVERPAGNTRG